MNDDNAGKPLEEFNGAGVEGVGARLYCGPRHHTNSRNRIFIASFIPSNYFGTRQYIGAV